MSPDVLVPVSVLLEAIRAHAEAVGQRRAAADVGMSAGGIHALLHGTSPHPGTVAKLRAWYLSRSPVAPEQARAILALLLEPLPEARRDAVARELAGRVAEESRAAGVEVPAWVGALLR